MVAVAGGLAEAHRDYAIVKVLHQLVKGGERADRIQPLDASINFSKMKAGEILYIVGHGVRDTGEIKNVSAAHLIGWLNDGAKGIPNNIGGINILTCYGGRVYGNDSLASTVAAGLNHQNITVKGALGFAYGSPETVSDKLNSVLPVDFDEFYSGTDEAAMLVELKKLRATQNYMNWEKTFIPNYNGGKNTNVIAGQKFGDRIDEDLLKTWISHFVKTRDALETRMKTTLAREKKGTLAKTLRALINQNDFGTYVQQQYDLHQFLFLPIDQAYTEETS